MGCQRGRRLPGPLRRPAAPIRNGHPAGLHPAFNPPPRRPDYLYWRRVRSRSRGRHDHRELRQHLYGTGRGAENQGTLPAENSLKLSGGSLPNHWSNTSLTVQGVVHAKANPYYMGVTFPDPGFQVTMTSTTSGFTLYGDGTVKDLSGNVVSGAMWPGWDIARSLVVRSNETSGYILDGYGSVLHPFGGAPAISGTPYWSGWDIARSMVLLTDTSGYILDGWGGIHPFGGAPTVNTNGFSWVGWDIARSLVVLPNHTGGYVLDGYGGIHSFAIGGNAMPPVANNQSNYYWSGWDIARGFVLDAQGTGGYVLDGYGGIHSVGLGSNAAPPAPAPGAAYWKGRDIARGSPSMAAAAKSSTDSVDSTPSPSRTWRARPASDM